MDFYFNLAGSVVRVTGDDPAFSQDAGYLSEYRVPPQKYDRHMECRMVDELSAPEGKPLFSDPARQVYTHADSVITYIGTIGGDLSRAYLRVKRQGNRMDAEFLRSAAPCGIAAKSILKAMEVEHVAVDNGGFILHASCIEYRGEAIVFTAPSGTGKSTQADLWKIHRGAEVINGDRIMVRSSESGFQIVGIPFSGSSGISKNRVLPLNAIVYLQQAPDNKIRVLRGMEAFRRVWEGCSVHAWNRKDMETCMDTVMQTIARVPVLQLECTPDVRAVEALEAMLDQRRNDHA